MNERQQLANDPAPEGQHANDKNQPGNDVDGLAENIEPLDARYRSHEGPEFAELVFQRENDYGADYRSDNCAESADQGHQHHQA